MSTTIFPTLERRGRLRVAAPPAVAFTHFTPAGESAWVPDWVPEYLHPAEGTLTLGLRFRTRHGGEETLWMVTALDIVRGRVSYARITPGSRFGTVTVAVHADGRGGSEVEVGYSLTPLSADGNAKVTAQLAARGFAEMLSEWERLVGTLTAR